MNLTFSPHPGVDPQCPHCRGLSYVIRRDGEFAAAALCSCVSECPLCDDSGWTRTADNKGVKRCVCQGLKRRVRSFTDIRIPARLADRNLGNFQPTRDKRDAHRAVSRWLVDFQPRGTNPGLVLHGPVGRGKTHLMVALLGQLVFRYGVTARFVEFSHLLADLKSGFDRGQGSARLLEPLVGVDVLGIDELGKGRNTEFEGTVLDELVSRRYNAGRTILATSNYPPGAATGLAAPNLATQRVPTLPDRCGPRVYSRLQEMCTFITVGGVDWRERIRTER